MTGKHKGGTLLGLVIGILGGLGVALAVALYITKVPVPLTAKTLQHSPESDAAELKKNQNWDPNAPLAGKSALRPNPVASGEIVAGVQPPPPAPVASQPARLPERAASKVPKAVVAAAPEPAIAPVQPLPAKAAKARAANTEDDELGQFIAAAPARPTKPADTAIPALPPLPTRADTAIPAIAPVGPVKSAKSAVADPISPAAKERAAEPAGASDPFTYFIQAGAFRTPEEAEKQRSRLQSLGVTSRVTEREQAGRMVYRVRVGPFEKKDEADKMQGKMEGQSISVNLVRVQR